MVLSMARTTVNTEKTRQLHTLHQELAQPINSEDFDHSSAGPHQIYGFKKKKKVLVFRAAHVG